MCSNPLSRGFSNHLSVVVCHETQTATGKGTEYRAMGAIEQLFITLCQTGHGSGSCVPTFPHLYGPRWKNLLGGLVSFLLQDLEVDVPSGIFRGRDGLAGVCVKILPWRQRYL